MRDSKRWLNSRHPYNNNVIRTLSKNDEIDGPKLGEYIASSAPIHLTDGWNYLSRAFDAICRGDRSSAIHLAYYAELRAAISLLATEGVGIFNRRHIALDNRLKPTQFAPTGRPGRQLRRGTHADTWRFLSAWNREPGRAGKLLEAITVESKSLSTWLADIGVVEPSRQFVARKWLNAWSIDLKILSSDPRYRNEMSYRPSRIRSRAPDPVDPELEMANPVFNSWNELEPEIRGTSASLDVSLLRNALMLAVDEGISNYATYGQALSHLELNYPEISRQTFDTLHSGSQSASDIFREAAKRNAKGNEATPVLARSLLMLRLASASTARLLANAEVSKSDLEFWWSPLGSDLGLWDDFADVDTFADLWRDVADAKDEAERLVSTMQHQVSVYTISGILGRYVPLTQFSRAPMWLLQID